MTVRVLERDVSARRLTLTMKRLLLEEKLAPFTSWEVCPLSPFILSLSQAALSQRISTVNIRWPSGAGMRVGF